MTDQEAWQAACHMMKYGMLKLTTIETKTYCKLLLKDEGNSFVSSGDSFVNSGFTENAALRGLYDQFLEKFPYDR